MTFAIKKRNNGSEVEAFRRSISNIFDDFFNMKPSSMFDPEWVPAIDVHEDGKGIYIKADVPGIDEKNLEVSIENDILTIKGEKSEEFRQGDDKIALIMERSYGSFQRSIRLPESVKADNIKAEFKHGVLKIDIPKEKAAETKKIKININ